MNVPTVACPSRIRLGVACLFAVVTLAAASAPARPDEQPPAPPTPVEPATAEGTAEPAAPPAAGPETVKEIKMYAENWKWTPNSIRVPRGTHLRISVENVDAPHRFELKAYKLNVPLPQRETTVIDFVANKPGEFRWRCSRPCGNGCPKMTGTLTVE